MNRNKQEGDMKKYPILLLAWLLPFGARAQTNTLRAKLTEALKTYCVPPDEQTCGSYQARYQNGSCYCGNPDYTYYDAAARRCRIKCPAGQIPQQADVCPSAGYGGLLVKDF
jgi:hypothetical protein